MTKEEAMKQFAQLGAVWFGNINNISHSQLTTA